MKENYLKDLGVVINGVRWATRNVAAPGTFAASPEDAGMFYQWNRKVGWPSTGIVTDWNCSWQGGYTSPSSSDTWIRENDPSPKGWRIPTYAEILTLLDATKVTYIWTIQNGVYGEKFTDKTTGNTLFLPASGYRDDDGTLNGAGSYGNYWGSTALYGGYYAYSLYFYSGDAYWGSLGRADGYSVRPVAK